MTHVFEDKHREITQAVGQALTLTGSRQPGMLRAWERGLTLLSEGKFPVSNLMGYPWSRVGVWLDERSVGNNKREGCVQKKC